MSDASATTTEGDDRHKLLDEVKCNIRSLLLSAKGGVAAATLEKDYESLCCSRLPLQRLGFRSVSDLLLSLPDVCTCRSSSQHGVWVTAVADASTQHIKKMVDRQRESKPTRRPRAAAVGFAARAHRSVLAHRHQPRFLAPGLVSRVRGGLAGHLRDGDRVIPRPRPPLLHRPYTAAKASGEVVAVRRRLTYALSFFPRGVSPGVLIRSYHTMFGQTFDPFQLGFDSFLQLLVLPPPIASIVTQNGVSSQRHIIYPLRQLPNKPVCPRVQPLMPNKVHPPRDKLTSDADAIAGADAPDSNHTNDNKHATDPTDDNHSDVAELKHATDATGAKHATDPATDNHAREAAELKRATDPTADYYSDTADAELAIDPDEGETSETEYISVEDPCEEESVSSDDDNNLQMLQQLSAEIRQILLPFPGGLSLPSLYYHYQIRFGQKIPLQKLGVSVLDDLSAIIPAECFSFQVGADGTKRVISLQPEYQATSSISRPPDVADGNFRFSRVPFPDLPLNEFNLEIRIAEVFSPFRFYFHLTGSEYAPALDTMMNEIDIFYSLGMDAKYRMLPEAVQVGQVCVCPYSDQGYHRVSVLDCDGDRAMVYYVDYGTIEWQDVCKLRYLHTKFCSLPAQALLGRLHNVRAAGESGWSDEANKQLLSLLQASSTEKYLAVIRSREIEETASFTLWDTSTDVDININDKMVELGHAVFCSTEDEIASLLQFDDDSCEYNSSDVEVSVISSRENSSPPSVSEFSEKSERLDSDVADTGPIGSDESIRASSSINHSSRSQSPTVLLRSMISEQNPSDNPNSSVKSKMDASIHHSETSFVHTSRVSDSHFISDHTALYPTLPSHNEVLDKDSRQCSVKAISVFKGRNVHVVNVDGSYYMTSADVSSLFWTKDILSVVVRVKQLGVSRIQITLHEHEHVYAELIDKYVSGVVIGDDEDLVHPLWLYHVSCLKLLINTFNFKPECIAAAKAVLRSFLPIDPHFQSLLVSGDVKDRK